MREALPRVASVAGPAALALLTWLGVLFQGPDPLRLVAAAVTCGTGLLIRPGSRLLLVWAAVAAAGMAVVCNGNSANIGWFGLVVLTGWIATIGSTATWVTFWAGAVALLIGEWVLADRDTGWAAWIAGTSFTAIGFWLGRRERDLTDQLRQAQAGLADQARGEERNRIARELHDVIGHSMTVSLLHVTSARLALDEEPAEAARALAEAERLGRAALAEVRQVVGLLRRADAAAAAVPLPGAADLNALVNGFRSARVPVSFTCEGPADGLPATVGLAVYRLLQESLTNSVRHAPDAAITARLTVTGTRVSLVVDSVGPGAAPAHQPTAGGIGLHSMRERAEALGGTCTAGPTDTGWRVTADLPLHATPAQPAAQPAPAQAP